MPERLGMVRCRNSVPPPLGGVLILPSPGSLPSYGRVSGLGDLDLGYCLRSERSTIFIDGGYKLPWSSFSSGPLLIDHLLYVMTNVSANSLPGMPLWLSALYFPAFKPINLWWMPAMW